MADVVIYTSDHCVYCDRAKQLLSSHGVHYEEVRVDINPEQRQIMMQKSGQRTVPQIFIGGNSIGGFDALQQLQITGELDQLLK